MAISTYSELQSALGNWLGRSDVTATRYQEMIALCEAKLQRMIRTPEMETRNAAFTINAEYMALPTGFLEVKSFYLNTNPPTPVRFMSDDGINGLFNPNSTGIPKFFNIQASNFRFAPSPGGTYTASLTYYRRFTQLASTTTNFVLTDHPDVYLYGSLVEAEGFLVNDSRIMTWRQQYDAALSELKMSGRKMLWSGQSMAVRVS